ncbi:quinone oxidoreductase family protein [Bogoriella caseilytica]|uniref:Alcohol dehydrogenase n=1 Tax=Bogoriella caseilytica TaxID=56055 RepID=A0A3N2BCZ2_9MICO|nr:zinc-binding dehydrogenase [Bogoriella caseilytica]ROR73092.1 alcohol dehydrogenase [Bogoriella caseilytica]
MKALVLSEHGDLDQLTVVDDHPRPQLAAGHVVLKVTASSYNYHDLFTVNGMPGIKVPLPIVPGLDLAGEVTEVAEDVSGWQAGDRVLVHPRHPEKGLMGEMLDGGMAEYALVHASQLIRIPEGVTDVQAAALPVAYGTAHRMIMGKGEVKAGDKVLILGASGGVGTASVVLCKKLGAHVIAAAGSDEKCQALLEMGADEVINYREENFLDWVKAHYGKPHRLKGTGGVDVVINFTGGDTWAPTLRSVKLGGAILVCGATAGYDPKEDLRFIWSFELRIIGSNSFRTEDFEALLEMCAAGEIDPPVSHVLPLSESIEGLRKVRDREVLGKIVIEPWAEVAR